MYGVGDGTFYDPVEFAAGAKAYGIALADINKDNALDVVTSSNARDFVGVTALLNTGGNATAVTSSANPIKRGSSVTFTATVTPADVKGVSYPTPTGTAFFYYNDTHLIGSAPLSSGKAALATTSLPSGTLNIKAVYGGDNNYVRTTSAELSQTVTAFPDYTLAANPTTQSVNPGSSANYTITVSAVDGYDGSVSFASTSCSGLPSGAACSFSPGSVSGSGTTTLTITTTGPSASLTAPPSLTPNPSEPNLWASLGGVGFVGLVLAGDWKKRNRRRMMIAFAVFALIMIVALVGCGGGSSSSGGGGGGGGTPANTYPITIKVSGTAGSNGGNTAQHTLTVTLKVN